MQENGQISTKTCSKCHKTKPIDEFHKRKVSKDGYRGQCIACEREYHKDYNAFNRDGIKLEADPKKVPTVRCSKCKERKPETAFNAANNEVRGIRSICKSCQAKEWAEYSSQFEDAS